MSRISLSETSEWRLANPEYDMRGMEAFGQGGTRMGRVVDMLVDPSKQEVYGVQLDTGKIYSARQARIGDGKVYVDSTRSEHGQVQVTKDFGQAVRIRPRDEARADSAVNFEEMFRRHFEEHYGPEEEYERFRSAYELGRRAAMRGVFVGRPYRDARLSLRSTYSPKGNQPSFSKAEEAVRFAFEQVSRVLS